MIRQLTLVDYIIGQVDTALRSVFIPTQRTCMRETPGEALAESPLSTLEKKQVAGLMRVNHAGEVCAQALYQGQAATAKLTEVKKQMTEAAAEEIDHLAWCEQRLCELGSQPSVLNPFWYSASFMIGALAGIAGDQWSLGFVAETERQVTAHLKKHLQEIPAHDRKTRAILAKMRDDEAHHADMAVAAGAAPLPFLIRQGMHAVSRMLTFSSYYI